MLRISNIHKAAGFSLFELVVFIISVAIIYAYAANRFADFPGQAERANFLAISTQIQTAINLEMMLGVGLNRISSPDLMEGTNPMEYMLNPPANYIGAFDVVNTDRVERRVWYFDRRTGELVYLVNDSQGVYLIVNGIETPTNEIRFKIVAEYGDVDTASGLPVGVIENESTTVPEGNRERRFNGVIMRPVYPYIWGEIEDAEFMLQTLADTSG
ncbi:MAG: hypothetical protein GKR91_09755 [Pseudomonadales bacterium]|nr:hypothetical protein [Pseudomonadales bacterium]